MLVHILSITVVIHCITYANHISSKSLLSILLISSPSKKRLTELKINSSILYNKCKNKATKTNKALKQMQIQYTRRHMTNEILLSSWQMQQSETCWFIKLRNALQRVKPRWSYGMWWPGQSFNAYVKIRHYYICLYTFLYNKIHVNSSSRFWRRWIS